MKKRFLSLVLALVMVLGLFSVTALAADIPFTDVPANQWYYHDVKNAFELGLINGKTETKFCPNDNLTFAEAAKLAACMHQRYMAGAVTLVNGDPWYQSYVDYCFDNGIIYHNYSWNEPASRQGYMEIFACALPDYALKAINEIPDNSIPDVNSSYVYAPGIYKLYRAGILQGNDDKHSCFPGAAIKRSEVAAILTRMMDESKRIKFSMTAPAEVPLAITKQPVGATAEEGQHITLEVSVTGGKAPYTYEWAYKTTGGEWEKDIDHMFRQGPLGEPKLEIICSSFNAMMGQPFRCTITDAADKQVVSQEITLTMEMKELSFTVQPEDVTADYGTSCTFHVEAAGGEDPYTYEWAYQSTGGSWELVPNNAYNSGVDTHTLTVKVDAGNPVVGRPILCQVWDSNHKNIQSNHVQVTPHATEPLRINRQPNSDIALENICSTQIGVLGGVLPYTFEWQYQMNGDWHVLEKKSGERFDVNIYTYNTYSQLETVVKLDDGTSIPFIYSCPMRCVVHDAAGTYLTSDTFSFSK